MKEIALQITAASRNGGEKKLNLLREYLQNYTLFIMQKVGMSASLYFVGGTALRFLYRIRRYSEDLDFSASGDWAPGAFPGLLKKIESQLVKAGYDCTFKVKSNRIVQKLIIGFSGLLYEAGLSHRRDQNLSIHIEIDINPPDGWQGERTIVDIHLPVVIRHYNPASLFAGKLHAVLKRKYTKGRDIYDLFWYRTKHKDLLPNFELLNNALAQGGEDFIKVGKENWLELLAGKIRRLDWESIKNDVLPFLEYRDDLLTFTKENLLLVL